MKLYNNSMVENLNKKIKKSLLIGLLPLIIVIPLYIVFLIIANVKTETLYQFLSSVLFVLWSWIFIFELTFVILPAKKRINHINSVLNNKEIVIEGVVSSISEPITLERSVRIVEVLITKEYERHKAYFNIDLNKIEIKENDNIKATLVNNFIKEYEVI